MKLADQIKKSKRKDLKSKGWKSAGAQDFLGLSNEELAKLLKSSQSRLAKMEAADPKVPDKFINV